MNDIKYNHLAIAPNEKPKKHKEDNYSKYEFNIYNPILHDAVYDNNMQVVQWLIDCGAEPEAENRAGENTVKIAKKCGFTELASYLEEIIQRKKTDKKKKR